MFSLEKMLAIFYVVCDLEDSSAFLSDSIALKPAGILIRVKFSPVQRTLTRAMLHLCPDLALGGSGTWWY